MCSLALVNPHHETFGRMMIVATAVSITGATALSLDPEFLIAHLTTYVTLPEPLVALLRWRLL